MNRTQYENRLLCFLWFSIYFDVALQVIVSGMIMVVSDDVFRSLEPATRNSQRVTRNPLHSFLELLAE